MWQKITFIIIIVLFIGIMIPKFTVHDLVPVDTFLKQCADISINLHQNNLFEKVALLLGKSRIIETGVNEVTIESFTIFRIPLGFLLGQPGMKRIVFCNPAQ